MHHLHDTKRVTAAADSTLLLVNFICVYGWSVGEQVTKHWSGAPSHLPVLLHYASVMQGAFDTGGYSLGLGDDVIATTEAT